MKKICKIRILDLCTGLRMDSLEHILSIIITIRNHTIWGTDIWFFVMTRADWSNVGGSDVTPEVTCCVIAANRTQSQQLATGHHDGRRPISVEWAAVCHVYQHSLDKATL